MEGGSFNVMVFLLVMVFVFGGMVETGEGQSPCSVQLSNLTTCAPYVVPGATETTPSPHCCSALQGVDQDCLCSTLHIVARMPSLCNLPPAACSP